MKRVVHIGVGSFFRAHQAWYTWKAADCKDWEVIGFTGRSADIAKTLEAQNYNYTLITRAAAGDKLETLDVLNKVLPAGDVDAFNFYVASKETAVITLTITEAGYDASSEELETSALFRLASALSLRASITGLPIALVPCDNLPANGSKLKSALLGFSSKLGEEYENYLLNQVDFVSTSVDRITPRTTQAELDLVAKAGLSDLSPVVTEPFTSWVLSGEFRAGRPAWETAGAVFVENIEPYERRKLWLLNGAHTLLSNIGLQLGLTTVAEAVKNPICRTALFSWWQSAKTQLSGVADLDSYVEQLLDRFENERIQHNLSQIVTDSLNKLIVRIVPVAVAQTKQGLLSDGIALTLAAWIANRLEGSLEDSRDFELAAAQATDKPIKALMQLLNAELASDKVLAQVQTELKKISSLKSTVSAVGA